MTSTPFTALLTDVLRIQNFGSFMNDEELNRVTQNIAGYTRQMVNNAVAARRLREEAQRAPTVVQRAPTVVQRPPTVVQRPPTVVQRPPTVVQRPIDLFNLNLSWEDYSKDYTTKRAIGKVRFDTKCKENCAICMENHTNGETILTECGHIYGKQCWQDWFNSANSSQTCPTCRKGCPKCISYTLRAERKKTRSEDNHRITAV